MRACGSPSRSGKRAFSLHGVFAARDHRYDAACDAALWAAWRSEAPQKRLSEIPLPPRIRSPYNCHRLGDSLARRAGHAGPKADHPMSDSRSFYNRLSVGT
jgi:hypothetical protein